MNNCPQDVRQVVSSYDIYSLQQTCASAVHQTSTTAPGPDPVAIPADVTADYSVVVEMTSAAGAVGNVTAAAALSVQPLLCAVDHVCSVL